MDQENSNNAPAKQSTINEFLDTLKQKRQEKRSSCKIISIYSSGKNTAQRAHQNESLQSALNYAKALDW